MEVGEEFFFLFLSCPIPSHRSSSLPAGADVSHNGADVSSAKPQNLQPSFGRRSSKAWILIKRIISRLYFFFAVNVRPFGSTKSFKSHPNYKGKALETRWPWGTVNTNSPEKLIPTKTVNTFSISYNIQISALLQF